MDSSQLFEKIKNSKPVDLGDILGKSMELFKKVWVQGFVHLLITMVVMIPLILVMYIPIILVAGIGGVLANSGASEYSIEGMSIGFLILFAILFFAVFILMVGLQFGITAHFYRICQQVDMKRSENSSYFMFFNTKYFGKVFLLSLAIFGIVLVAASLCYLPILYVIVPMQLLGVIFAFNPDLSVSDLLKASFNYGNKVWLIAFGLIVISAILSQTVGLMLCGVGVFFTASFGQLPIYYLYKDGIGFETEGSNEDQGLLLE